MVKKEKVVLFEYMLAKRIKELRLSRNMTIEEVANRTGFTKGFVSKIENNKVSPPIATLLKLSEALDVHIRYFFHKEDIRGPIIVTKNDRRRSICRERNGRKYFYESLALGGRDKKIESFVITIHARDRQEALLDQHEREEMIFVLKGEMEFIYGDKTYLVKEGDSLYFQASIPHGEKLIEGKSVKYLTVFTNG